MMLKIRFIRTAGWLLAALAISAAVAQAEVARVDVATRTAVGTSGYEKIVGTVHFAVDPKDPRNRVIADLDRAPVNAAGKVEFSADLYIMRPLDPARSNGVVFVDVVNRGRKTILRFNRVTEDGGGEQSACPGGVSASARGERAVAAPPVASIADDVDLGDEFLTRQGFTLVWVGWQFDVRRRGTALGIEVPKAAGVTGMVSAQFTPCDRRESQPIVDLLGYPPADPAGTDTTLTVRDDVFGTPEPVARGRWSLKGNVVSMPGGFDAGRLYEISYRAADPPIVGLGLASLRDLTAWIKRAPDALAPARYAYAFGSSQSGRFLRAFLYGGFNTDEKGGQVFDGVMAHIAGAAWLDITRRWATPNSLSLFTSTAFPFTTTSQRDPISGRTEGLLDNERARANQPKVFFTNTAVEQWGGGRAAALITTTADGKADVELPSNVRVYYFSGTQHSPGRFPARTVTGQQPYNVVDFSWALRALFVAMDGWVRQGIEPPPSKYPRLADGTLVPVERVAFPDIPGVPSPRIIPAGRQDGKPLPLLVPQVDADGNELAGLRLPEVAVPVATYTGWNFRNRTTGGANLLVNLLGSGIPFPTTRAGRESTRDPRRSIEERYKSKEAYVAQAREATERLVRDRCLRAEDAPFVMRRMEELWDREGGHRGSR